LYSTCVWSADDAEGDVGRPDDQVRAQRLVEQQPEQEVEVHAGQQHGHEHDLHAGLRRLELDRDHEQTHDRRQNGRGARVQLARVPQVRDADRAADQRQQQAELHDVHRRVRPGAEHQRIQGAEQEHEDGRQVQVLAHLTEPAAHVVAAEFLLQVVLEAQPLEAGAQLARRG